MNANPHRPPADHRGAECPAGAPHPADPGNDLCCWLPAGHGDPDHFDRFDGHWRRGADGTVTVTPCTHGGAA